MVLSAVWSFKWLHSQTENDADGLWDDPHGLLPALDELAATRPVGRRRARPKFCVRVNFAGFQRPRQIPSSLFLTSLDITEHKFHSTAHAWNWRCPRALSSRCTRPRLPARSLLITIQSYYLDNLFDCPIWILNCVPSRETSNHCSVVGAEDTMRALGGVARSTLTARRAGAKLRPLRGCRKLISELRKLEWLTVHSLSQRGAANSVLRGSLGRKISTEGALGERATRKLRTQLSAFSSVDIA